MSETFITEIDHGSGQAPAAARGANRPPAVDPTTPMMLEEDERGVATAGAGARIDPDAARQKFRNPFLPSAGAAADMLPFESSMARKRRAKADRQRRATQRQFAVERDSQAARKRSKDEFQKRTAQEAVAKASLSHVAVRRRCAVGHGTVAPHDVAVVSMVCARVVVSGVLLRRPPFPAWAGRIVAHGPSLPRPWQVEATPQGQRTRHAASVK